MPARLISFGRRLLWWRRLGNLWWADRLAASGARTYLDLDLTADKGLRIAGGSLILPRTDRATALLSRLADLRFLSLAGARYVASAPWDAIAIGDVNLQIFNAQTIQLAAEVFVHQTYAVTRTRPAVVLDVGMNIGTAALFFARDPDALVIGYEPFRETYEHAIANFRANRALNARIEAINAAWGSSSGTRRAQYCAESPGDCGFYEIPKAFGIRSQTVTEDVRVQSAPDCVRQTRSRYQDRDIILKLDCEGSEQEILGSLRDAGLLREMAVVMVEWHRRAAQDMPERIRDLLAGTGFVVFGEGIVGAESGMMRAVRV